MSRVLDNTRESLFDSASVVILSTFTFVSSRRSQLNTHFLRTSSKHTVISRRCVSGLQVLGERVLTPDPAPAQSLPFPRSTSFLDCYFWLTSRLSNALATPTRFRKRRRLVIDPRPQQFTDMIRRRMCVLPRAGGCRRFRQSLLFQLMEPLHPLIITVSPLVYTWERDT